MPFFSRASRHAFADAFARPARQAYAQIIGRLGNLQRCRRGAMVIFLAIGIIPLIAFIGISVDTTRGYLAKSQLSSAVDAAALAGARVFTSATRDADIRMYFKANYPDGFMGSTTQPLVITPNNTTKEIIVSAQSEIPTSFMHIIGIDKIPLKATATVVAESQNIEVAMVLDLTGSMVGQRTTDLKAAANQLVDIVVQPPGLYYTKVGLAPYSQAVNVGTYADQVRGTTTAGAGINGITKANPAVVTTATNHNLNTGDKVFISGVSGMTQANNNQTNTPNAANNPQFWIVQKLTNTTFSLKKCGNSSCSSGNQTAVSSTGWSNYTSTTSDFTYCMTLGCEYYAFQNESDTAWRTHRISTCVTERFGANVTTDAAASTTAVGRNYPSPSNTCIASQILPLSSDKTTLHSRINALTAGGSTGGQIGVAWGWYLVSPTFGAIFPVASRPSAYNTAATLPQNRVMKVVVLMTDGEYNSVYRNGVIAQDSLSGSGSDDDHINQNSNNGNPYTQAGNLCTAMKAAPYNVIVYTVGLDLVSKPEALNLVNNCATGPSYVYLPANGTELQTAFQDIAQQITKLRLKQ